MIVYGDRSEHVDPGVRLALLADDLTALHGRPAGIDRHAAAVSVFIDAAMLLQGIADADFAVADVDRRTAAVEVLTELVVELAHVVRISWNSALSTMPPLPAVPQLSGLPAKVELRTPEGYAFYALYPEACLAAARALRLCGPARVIGIRSIGTGLAALVAAELGAAPPVTVRPAGHPFDRYIALAPDLAAGLLSDPAAHYIVVDEGPGLSGSSFGAVADWLEERGVQSGRIAFLPSHGGDLGPQACERHRARWAMAQRRAVDIGPQLPDLLAGWAADMLGPLDEPLLDLSGGAWRSQRYSDEAAWPPVNAHQERRKFLARVGGRSWLLKFVGLGREGERKLARARALHAAGFVPEPRGLVHGFLVERWHDDATAPDMVPLDHLGRYLGARARLLATGHTGAALEDLLAMARHNTTLALGSKRAAALDRWSPRLSELAMRVVTVESDNRLDLPEWLRLPNGRLLKSDAVDHHAAHDLIGCQDIAWDVAGAAAEFDLDERSIAVLTHATASAAGRPVDRELLAFLTPCYLAFRLGQSTLASASLKGWPAEAARLNRQAERYTERLDHVLATA